MYFTRLVTQICLFVLSAAHWNNLRYPLSGELYDGAIHDIWSAVILRPLTSKGQFLYTEHLALSINTDGVPLFKSSSTSFSPVYLIVHNLPPSIRRNEENIVLCAVWCGPSKPEMSLLLELLTKMLEELRTVGIQMTTPGTKVVRGKLMFNVFDMPAKAATLTMKQFNGEYGCPTCLHPGKRLQNGARVYLPADNIEPRTHQTVVENGQLATQRNEAVCGVKGTTLLAREIDLVKGVPVDYMHAVLEGMTRWLLHAWFDSTNHK